MHLQGVLLYLISIPNVLLGSLILIRNAKEHVNIYFASFAISVAIWAFGLANYIFTDDKHLALNWAQLYYIAAAIIAFSFFGFSMTYTKLWKSFHTKQLFMGLPMLLMIIAILFYPEFLFVDLIYRDWGKEIILDKSGYLAYTIYFSAYVAIGFIAILKAYINSRSIQRTYLKYIFLGLIVAFSMGATFNLVLPFLGNYQYIWVGPLFTLFYVSFISYAIIKHKLFDIRFVVARSLAYALSIGFLLVFYGGISTRVTTYLADNYSNATNLRYGLMLLVISLSAISFNPIKLWFDKFSNKIFFRDAYDPQEFLDQVNKLLVGQIQLEVLLKGISSLIVTHIKPTYCVFVVRETGYESVRIIGTESHEFDNSVLSELRGKAPHHHNRILITDELDEQDTVVVDLKKLDISVLIRLISNTSIDAEGQGYLVLGPKKNGTIYTSQDKKVLDILSNEMVIAVDNALRFEEIQKFNVTLQQKIDDATKKLRKTNEKLKALDETKDEFISMASHQLRTPLTSVKGYLSMVLEGDVGKLPEMQRKMLDQAFVSSQRMVYLIADLLNVSRLRTGKFVIEPVPTQLADVVEEEVGQLKETAKARKLSLEYEKPTDFPMVMLDETKIRQVIMNFMDNAIYYTPSGGSITVHLKDTGDNIEYTVTDTGIGIPKWDQAHMFTKFYRAGNAKKARPDGTGLGLFMAKKVVVAQGGSVILKSEEGKGSTFGFRFNKAKLQELHDAQAKKDEITHPKPTDLEKQQIQQETPTK